MLYWFVWMVLHGLGIGVSSPALAQKGQPPSVREAPSHGKKQRRRKGTKLRSKGGKTKTKAKRRGRTLQGLPLPEDLSQIAKAVSSRRYRTVIGLANQRLADDPWNPHLHAALTVGCGFYGDYGCVDASHDEAQSTESLVLMREEAMADALRYLGQPEEAARLRRTLIIDNPRASRETSLLAKLVQDHVAAGDLDAAWDAAWEAVALEPDETIGWALVARVEAAAGRPEDAESYLWLAARNGSDSLVETATRADVARDSGDPHFAATLFDDRLISRVKSMQYAVARARAFLAADLHDEVLDMHRDCSWCLGETVWHPELLATFGEALARGERADEARECALRLEQGYPTHPPSMAAARAIRARLHSRL